MAQPPTSTQPKQKDPSEAEQESSSGSMSLQYIEKIVAEQIS